MKRATEILHYVWNLRRVRKKKRKERNIGEKWKKYGKKILLCTELEFVNFLSSSLKTKQWKVIFLKLPLLPFLSQNTTNIF